MRLIYNSDAQRLQKDFDDKTPTSVSEMLKAERTSSVPIELFLVDNDGGYATPGTSDYEVVIGRSAQKLTTGLLKLTWTGTTEAIDLSKPKLATRIESALNAVSEIDTAGGVDVVELTNGRGYQITFRSVGSRAAITAGVSESMQPATATLTEVTAGDSSTKEVQLLTLEEASLAEISTGSWSASSAPALTISTLVAGTSNTREVQKLSISGDPAPGSFFVVSDSEPISTEATAAQVKTILNSALSSDIGSVKKTGEREWQVTYKTNGDKAALSAGTHNLVRRPGISATLSLNTTALAYASNSDGSDLSIGFTLRKSNEVIISEKISLSEPFAEVLGSTAMLTNDSIGALFKIDSNEINKGQAITISGGLTYNGSTHDLAAPFLPLAGGTMTGAVAMGSQKITGLADGTASGDAINKGQLDGLIDNAPEALNTLNELAAALGDDVNFSTTVATNIATKLPLAGGTMTGAILHSSGSAGEPSISFSDSDTGLFSVAADQLGISTGGSERVHIYNDGFDLNNLSLVFKDSGGTGRATLGIPSQHFAINVYGTSGWINNAINIDNDTGSVALGNSATMSTANAQRLIVGDGAGAEGITIYSGTDNSGFLYFADGTSSSASYRGALQYNHTTDTLTFDTAASNRMTLTSSGLGVGTTSPNFLIDCEGAGGGLRVYNTTTDGDTEIHIRNTGTTGEGRILFGDSGDTDIGKIVYDHDGDDLIFTTNATEAARFDSSGRLGIGCTPTANLDITTSLNQQHLYIEGALDSGSTALARLKTISNGNVLLLESATTSDSREIFDVKNSNGSVFKIQGDGVSVFSGAVNASGIVKIEAPASGFGEQLRLTRGSGGVYYSFGLDNDKLNICYNATSSATSGIVFDGSNKQLKITGSQDSDDCSFYLHGGVMDGSFFGTDGRLTVKSGTALQFGDSSASIKRDSGTFKFYMNGDIQFLGPGSSDVNMHIESSNRHVGIGTTSPGSILEIQGDGGNNKQLRLASGSSSVYWDLGRNYSTGHFEITEDSGDTYFLIDKDNGTVELAGGAIALSEISTPTAKADWGKIYTKSDNKLYFQDGAGTEHEIAFA